MLAITEKMLLTQTKELQQFLQQYSQLQTKLDQHDFYRIPAKMQEVAAGLGISQ
ncbi:MULTISPECIES: hypothetical protein [Clostridia]|uniref:hypothetical protein n=1 Tax=Clostridia TaxID=186801 RepID=UPI001314FD01|nr:MULTISPECIES: hypothetical protein [Clostridia]